MAARRADRLLREGPGHPAGRGARVGQALPGVEPGAGRSRRAASAGTPRRGVDVRTGALVTGIAPVEGGWRWRCNGALPLHADTVIVATGGLSVPNTGSDGAGLAMLPRPRPHHAPDLCGADAARRPIRRRSASSSGVSLTVTITARASERTATGHRRIPLHPSGLQRALRARRVARCGPVPRGRRCAGAADGAVDARSMKRGWESALAPTGRRTVGRGLRRPSCPTGWPRCCSRPRGIDPARPLAQLARRATASDRNARAR